MFCGQIPGSLHVPSPARFQRSGVSLPGPQKMGMQDALLPESLSTWPHQQRG